MRFSAWPILLLLLVGCGRPSRSGLTSRPAPTPLPADPWVLGTSDPTATEPAWLSNGLIGVRIGRDGNGVGADGKPLPFFVADEYDTEGEEKIRTLPNPLAVTWRLEDKPLSAKESSDYRQKLDMRTAVLKTEWTQDAAQVSVDTIVDPTVQRIAQKWTVTPRKQGVLNLESVLAGQEQTSSSDGTEVTTAISDYGTTVTLKNLYMAQGNRIEKVPGGFTFSVDAEANRPVTLYRSVEIGSQGAKHAIDTARGKTNGRTGAFRPTDNAQFIFEDVQSRAEKAWSDRWKTDIEIDGPVEDQQAVRSFMFYLQMAVNPKAPVSVPPMGLSSAQYNGHVFWDADIWIFPALTFVNPDLARAIPNYRLQMADAAQRNHLEWVQAGFPSANGPRGRVNKSGDMLKYQGGAMFPWESSVTGRETVPGPSRWQHHITGSVAWGLSQASALGLADPKRVDHVRKEATKFYLDRSDRGPDGLEIKGTMSPDENHIGDNDLYTNLLAEWLVSRGAGVPPANSAKGFRSSESGGHAGETPAPRFKRPRDETSLLTYDNDTVRSYKQAAAVLAIYPLQDLEAEEQAKVMMDRFSDKPTPNGPAMTDSVHATIWARIGESDKAYEAWHRSWKDFTQHPLLLFSEKRRKAVTYFVTGAGGSLQSVIYGFLGFRIDSRALATAKWSTKLQGERWLNVQPHLPHTWKSVRFKNFHVLGRPYTLTATPTAVKVTQGE